MIPYSPSPVCSQGGTLLDHEKYRSEDATQYTVWCAADDTVPTNVVLDLGGPNVVTGIGEPPEHLMWKAQHGLCGIDCGGIEDDFPGCAFSPNFFCLSTGFAGTAKA